MALTVFLHFCLFTVDFSALFVFLGHISLLWSVCVCVALCVLHSLLWGQNVQVHLLCWALCSLISLPDCWETRTDIALDQSSAPLRASRERQIELITVTPVYYWSPGCFIWLTLRCNKMGHRLLVLWWWNYRSQLICICVCSEQEETSPRPVVRLQLHRWGTVHNMQTSKCP